MSDKPALKCKYRYDPLDRWVGSQQTALSDCHLFYRKKHLTTCLQGYQSTRLFQHENLLLAQQDDAQAQLYITDRQRTVSGVPSTGRSHQRFTPYGYCSALHGFSSLLKFNGERPDPVTGHYLLGNGYRAYNPVLMRFNSPDSLSPFAEGGVNAYSYCLGDPVNRQDRDGHMSLRIMATVLKAVTRFKAPLKLKISNLPDVPFHKIIAHLNGADMTSLASTCAEQCPAARLFEAFSCLSRLDARLYCRAEKHLSGQFEWPFTLSGITPSTFDERCHRYGSQ